MAIVGETVSIVGDIIRDHRGRPIGSDSEDFQAVVVPEGTDLRPGDDSLVSFVTTTMKLLIPSGWEVPAKLVAGAQVSVRGEDYFVDGDQIDHRSPFGTGYGGVEVKLSTTPVA